MLKKVKVKVSFCKTATQKDRWSRSDYYYFSESGPGMYITTICQVYRKYYIYYQNLIGLML